MTGRIALLLVIAGCGAEIGTPGPYPASEHLRAVRWEPIREIQRVAVDSDNWPLTWGDDDAIYAAYGDGFGFEPYVDKKLSLGLVRIHAGPGRVRGTNLRAPTAELVGDGPKGGKASGMLMVDGTLYMLVRNLGNCRLAWSEDRGRTWEWGHTFKESFGTATFLNFGRDYAGARDGYVYIYTSDGPSTYVPYDRIILARVPKGAIRDRARHEFYAGEGRWTADFAARRGVFEDKGRCCRLDAAYHAPSGRYLLVVGADMVGAWGIYDAPEPWGPWTTVFHTDSWDVKDTHSYRLPTKWMDPAGRSAYLVFSGRPYKGVDYDAFCVRKLVFR